MSLLEEYKNDLLVPNCDLVKIYTKYIIAGEVWYFKEKFGAGWFGKYKNYKLFDDKSDIDIIISQILFYKFWNSYLVDSYSSIKVNNYAYVCACLENLLLLKDLRKTTRITVNGRNRLEDLKKICNCGLI